MHASLRLLIVCACMVAVTAPLSAQSMAPSSARDSVYAVVTRLFDGMRTRDTASMRAAFASSAALTSVTAAGVRSDAIDSWIASVGSAPAGVVLDERLGDHVVQVSGDLASVWVDYWFFVGDRFSHCGVDAFVLARVGGEWRILSVADTRQREGCRPAPGR
jgi:hypothetical protein